MLKRVRAQPMSQGVAKTYKRNYFVYLYIMQLLRDSFDTIVQDVTNGKIMLMPTDTIWALVCDATQPQAVQRIYEIKEQKTGTGLVTIVSDLDMLKEYVVNLHPRLETLLIYHTRTLTLLFEHTRNLPALLHGPDQTTAIRITFDPILRDMIARLGHPLVASAACTIDSAYPTHFGEIKSDILTRADYIMKYRQDDRRPFIPSVIARMGPDEELEFVRE
jgi:L-threonylcarbamoyladenylate synthase